MAALGDDQRALGGQQDVAVAGLDVAHRGEVAEVVDEHAAVRGDRAQSWTLEDRDPLRAVAVVLRGEVERLGPADVRVVVAAVLDDVVGRVGARRPQRRVAVAGRAEVGGRHRVAGRLGRPDVLVHGPAVARRRHVVVGQAHGVAPDELLDAAAADVVAHRRVARDRQPQPRVQVVGRAEVQRRGDAGVLVALALDSAGRVVLGHEDGLVGRDGLDAAAAVEGVGRRVELHRGARGGRARDVEGRDARRDGRLRGAEAVARQQVDDAAGDAARQDLDRPVGCVDARRARRVLDRARDDDVGVRVDRDVAGRVAQERDRDVAVRADRVLVGERVGLDPRDDLRVLLGDADAEDPGDALVAVGLGPVVTGLRDLLAVRVIVAGVAGRRVEVAARRLRDRRLAGDLHAVRLALGLAADRDEAEQRARLEHPHLGDADARVGLPPVAVAGVGRVVRDVVDVDQIPRRRCAGPRR